MMSQEDEIQNCGNGGRSCKKPKQKKVPQRGLGVAQLEKIRVEEQQKKDEAIASPAILPSPSSVSSTKSSYLPLPIPNFHHYNNQPCSSPVSLLSGSPLSLQNVDFKVPSTVIVPGHGSVPQLWSSNEYELEKESFEADPGSAFLSSMPHESDSNSVWPLPKWVQRTQPYQQPSSSMVNVSSGTSSTPLPYSMEPPSNQNYIGNCLSLLPEDKMIGMKRPYPFSVDVPPAPFNLRSPTVAAPMKINETSCGGGTGFNYAATATFREVPSSSTSNSEPNSKSKRNNTENENFNGDFLTLAPPIPASSLCPTSNFKSPSAFLGFHSQEYPHLDSCQGIIDDQITQWPGFSRFNQQQQPIHSFLPPLAKAAQAGQATAGIQNGNGEVGENVDLNLKL